jgi:hypothetical protein
MRYLSPAELYDELLRIDYRHPNVNISMFTHPYEGFQHVCVAVIFTAPNAYSPGEAQTQCVNIPVPPIVSAEHFQDWLKWRIQTIANHELNELFWLDGSIMIDPHSDAYWKLRMHQ